MPTPPKYHVFQMIQSTLPGSTDGPVPVHYYKGDDLAKALAALTSAAVMGDVPYVKVLSVTLEFVQPEPSWECDECHAQVTTTTGISREHEDHCSLYPA